MHAAVLLNTRSGPGHSREAAAALARVLRDAGCEAQVEVAGPDAELRDVARRLLERRPDVLVAAGGDGTVSSLADVVRDTDTALGIVPLGTLNHFAKDLGIPADWREAARVVARGKRARVDVGEVNGSCFLNNASLGLYPDIVRERTRQQRRLRRSKRMAMLWATLAVLDRTPLVDLTLELDGKLQACRAPFVFVGNNDYVLEGFDIGKRERLDCGVLTVYTTRSCTAGGLLALAVRVLARRLRQADDFLETSATRLRVESRRKRIAVATDGEVAYLETPLEFRMRARSLQVVVP